MRCIRPLKASFNSAGDITYSSRKAIPGLVPFEFECRKCLPCRLNIAREKAVRALHEAKMHEDNIFLTATYDDEHLVSPRLIYADFQNFMKSLREKYNRYVTDPDLKKERQISYLVTGEYGELNKRPHWHAILFNYAPQDPKKKYTTDLGEIVYESEELTKLWKKGAIEYGSVTIESAGYVARYAAKKLVHGKDQDHDYHPIHKTSSRRAIGRSWIEKYWEYTFKNGHVILPNGTPTKIPRYYVDWLKKHQPDAWLEYVSTVREDIIKKAEKKSRKEEMDHISMILSRKGGTPYPLSRPQVKERILNSKFARLQEKLKL